LQWVKKEFEKCWEVVKKIKNAKVNKNGGQQALYDYVIGASPDDLINSGIHYSDTDNLFSNIFKKREKYWETINKLNQYENTTK
jgi:hypothetical protein